MTNVTTFSNKEVEVEVRTLESGAYRAKLYKKTSFIKFIMIFGIIPWFSKIITKGYIASATYPRESLQWANMIKDPEHGDLIANTLEKIVVDDDHVLDTTPGHFNVTIRDDIMTEDCVPPISTLNYVVNEERADGNYYYKDMIEYPDNKSDP